MSLRRGDTTELEPGMTFHMIVGIWMDGIGYDLSEMFLVTPDGPECLSTFPRELIVKG
jgi:ectoine hydrolase